MYHTTNACVSSSNSEAKLRYVPNSYRERTVVEMSLLDTPSHAPLLSYGTRSDTILGRLFPKVPFTFIKRAFYLGVLLFALLLAGCGEADPLEELRKVSEEINEKCPVMIDSETRLDGIAVREPNTLIYKFSLMSLVNEGLDTVMFHRALWPGIISNIKVSAEMKKLRDNQTQFEYYYQDKNGKRIYTFRITPEDYK